MKLLYAECCGDLVVPSRVNHEVRWCSCKKSGVWWVNGTAGRLACHSFSVQEVSVIGLHNGLLTAEFIKYAGSDREYGCIQKNTIRQLVDVCSPNFLFKHVESLVVRMRPGFSNDTFFVAHPSGLPGPDRRYERHPVTVVVNGQEVMVETGGSEPAACVLNPVMAAAKRNPDECRDWRLTTEKGVEIPLLAELCEYGIMGLGHRLHLNPPAGVGG